ncbi:alpha-E domain-containing protein [Sphingomonas sp. ID1715]|uniref:alpha-E domain-containing protein n=1 Tax=Sphingomonas sp. ID1715 TaxID=1656898 RepID=UPI001488D9C4|nr:alpha-E domain-containing protein [Sphingomonas sp. ID1715]NNM76896.1 alpha-E domain-containing protein [Sphingomonas sp. ID1715]
MLSRTAASLYWAGRYLERADFTSRLIDATIRLAALPSSYGGDVGAWGGALAAAGAAEDYAATFPELEEASACQYLSLDPNNSSSMRCCIERARNNARAVRTAITAEAWEAINAAWLDLQRYGVRLDSRTTLNRLLDAVKAAALSFDGAIHRTMLRHDSYWFLRLGATIERADNTARLLDVKYHLLLPGDERVGGSLDYFQWTTILRTVSALTAYRHVYRDSVKPWLVADLLILNRQMPRSLAACAQNAVRYLDQLAQESGRRGAAHRQAVRMARRLETSNIDSIFKSGLHEEIQDFLRENNKLGLLVGEQFLF